MIAAIEFVLAVLDALLIFLFLSGDAGRII